MGVIGMKKRIIGIIIAFVLFVLIPSPLTADIDKYEFRVIKIAFANGCIRALKADLETIRSLKENDGDLRKYVEREVNKYMQEVAQLTLMAKEREKSTKEGESSKSNLWK